MVNGNCQRHCKLAVCLSKWLQLFLAFNNATRLQDMSTNDLKSVELFDQLRLKRLEPPTTFIENDLSIFFLKCEKQISKSWFSSFSSYFRLDLTSDSFMTTIIRLREQVLWRLGDATEPIFIVFSLIYDRLAFTQWLHCKRPISFVSLHIKRHLNHPRAIDGFLCKNHFNSSFNCCWPVAI